MDETDWLTERFEEHRSRLRGVAYRMLGSLSEADDAVQEAWLRLARADPDSVADLPAWLTTVVARVCLNMLRTREHRREQPLDEYVPGPIIGHEDRGDPEYEVVLADSVGLALLVVLDTLTPAERLAFVLHDMFDLPFDDIAPIVDRSPAAARQLASREHARFKQTDADVHHAAVPADLEHQRVRAANVYGPASVHTLIATGVNCRRRHRVDRCGSPNTGELFHPCLFASYSTPAYLGAGHQHRAIRPRPPLPAHRGVRPGCARRTRDPSHRRRGRSRRCRPAVTTRPPPPQVPSGISGVKTQTRIGSRW